MTRSTALSQKIWHETPDGWKTITRGRRSKHPTSTPRSWRTNGDTPVDLVRADELAGRIADYLARLGDSDCARSLKLQVPPLSEGPYQALCAGLGSLDPDSRFDSRRALTQLSFFKWFLATFTSGNCGPTPRIIATDPAFSALDIAVLNAAQVDAGADEPRNALKLSDESILFAPFLPWPVISLQYLAQAARPCLVICQDMRTVMEQLDLQLSRFSPTVSSNVHVDGQSYRMEDVKTAHDLTAAFIERYDTVRIPPCELHPSAFEDLCIYVRRGTGPDGSTGLAEALRI